MNKTHTSVLLEVLEKFKDKYPQEFEELRQAVVQEQADREAWADKVLAGIEEYLQTDEAKENHKRTGLY